MSLLTGLIVKIHLLSIFNVHLIEAAAASVAPAPADVPLFQEMTP